jgi:hypothetical protein
VFQGLLRGSVFAAASGLPPRAPGGLRRHQADPRHPVYAHLRPLQRQQPRQVGTGADTIVLVSVRNYNSRN